MGESSFQAKLINELHEIFPEAVILKNDPNYLQGFPDLTILFDDTWAVLETKKSATEPHRANQDYYVKKANVMAFGRFIFPENKDQIIDELITFVRGS